MITSDEKINPFIPPPSLDSHDLPKPPARASRTGVRNLRPRFVSPTDAPANSASFGDLTQEIIRKNEYSYVPLEAQNGIRILHLDAGKDDDPIQCRLIPCKLDTAYEALSYYWGTDEPENEIKILRYEGTKGSRSILNIKHQKFFIRSNLFSALRGLRNPETPIVLWIDAICINQEDDDEKKSQVAMMEDIYRRAEKVLIWLGEPTNLCPSESAFPFIKKVCDLRQFDTLLKPKYADDWESLAKLMRNVWFSRRWVVQELALAREAILCSGTISVHWDDFADAIAFFVLRYDQIKRIPRVLRPDDPDPLREIGKLGPNVLVDATSNLFRKDGNGDVIEHRMTLESLVSTLTAYEASDPRDTIYAVLSLAKDSSRPDIHGGNTTPTPNGSAAAPVSDGDELHNDNHSPSNPVLIEPDSFSDSNLALHGISPDYEKDLMEVCKDFVNSCITCSKSLDIICRNWAPVVKKFTKLDKKDVSKKMTLEQKNWVTKRPLASWMPSIKGGAYGAPQDALAGRQNGDSLVGPPQRQYYNASFGIRTNDNDDYVKFGIMEEDKEFFDPAPREVSNGTLLVMGLEIDTVDIISSRCSNGTILAEALNIGGFNPNDENIEDVPDELWRTMVADRGPNAISSPKWYMRACHHAIAMSNNGDLDTKLLIDQGRDSIVVEFLTRVFDVVSNRKFFRSANKRRLGLAPPKAEKGDIICILFGCSVPVLLRRVENGQHILVGECYVHGMMDGEAISAMTKKQLRREQRQFTLQ
ncbi:Heterokaryon incompatibility protein 6 OR allele [Lachnellula suecica]|uniref:Heterokaryon incompatibility protein 6 OR allele n=1 Tax=Lachnellula suecica TaxID=602035 RepID=A0A8T9BYW1_9HELO|nr:Heterokaryon incompatibility protein 6 OR allele [Lachnellula suecica]